MFVLMLYVSPVRITKMLIEQDGPGWREKLPEIPVVPLSVQQQHRDKPVSAEVAQARAARAAQEEGQDAVLASVPSHMRTHVLLF